MQETINVNIGSEAFTLDQDAYRVLQSYFEDIRSHLPSDDTETMDDVEIRMAEIFRETTPSPMQVVTLFTVRAAIGQMGAPEEFGEQTTPDPQSESAAPHNLYRSRTDQVVAGVCGGLAEFFNINAALLRLITLLLILLGGLSMWLYIVLWIIVPQAPETNYNNTKQ